MNRLLTLISAVAVLGACDSHSWEKETSHLFHKKGGDHGAHGASPTSHDAHPAAATHAPDAGHAEEKKSH